MRRIAGHLGRILLGGVFLISGIAKGLTPGEFARQVEGYAIIGKPFSEIIAPALIVLEIALGIALVCAVRPALTALAAIVMLLLFIGIEAYGMAVGRTDACGCFGAYVQRTPAEVIGEDLLFIALGGLSLWGLRGWTGLRPGRALAVLSLALGISTTFVLASPTLPFFNIPFLSRLAPGATLADLKLDKRLPELSSGRHLVAVFDVTDPKSASL